MNQVCLKQSKDTGSSQPKKSVMLREHINKLRNLRSRSTLSRLTQDAPTSSELSREVIREYLAALAPSGEQLPPGSLSKDLEAVSNLIASLSDATDEDILTPEEADTVINFVMSKFIERRFDRTLFNMLHPSTGSWFLLAAGLSNEPTETKFRTRVESDTGF